MLVKNRYGGVQAIPDRLARALIKAGTVTTVDAAPKPKPTPAPKPKKAKKAA